MKAGLSVLLATFCCRSTGSAGGLLTSDVLSDSTGLTVVDSVLAAVVKVVVVCLSVVVVRPVSICLC